MASIVEEKIFALNDTFRSLTARKRWCISWSDKELISVTAENGVLFLPIEVAYKTSVTMHAAFQLNDVCSNTKNAMPLRKNAIKDTETHVYL